MKKLIPLFLLVFFLSSCDKEIETPPCCTCDVPYSESGLNVLDCYMEGSPWSVCDSNKKIIKPGFGFYRNNLPYSDYWQFSNTKFKDGGEEILYVHLWSPKLGKIPYEKLNDSKSTFGFITAWFKNSKRYKGSYTTDTSNYAYLEITKFDTINHIISGRFDCTLIEDNGGVDTATIKITNGVFDFQYK